MWAGSWPRRCTAPSSTSLLCPRDFHWPGKIFLRKFFEEVVEDGRPLLREAALALDSERSGALGSACERHIPPMSQLDHRASFRFRRMLNTSRTDRVSPAPGARRRDVSSMKRSLPRARSRSHRLNTAYLYLLQQPRREGGQVLSCYRVCSFTFAATVIS